MLVAIGGCVIAGDQVGMGTGTTNWVMENVILKTVFITPMLFLLFQRQKWTCKATVNPSRMGIQHLR